MRTLLASKASGNRGVAEPAALGEQIDGWRVCWLGGWGKKRLFYYVMVAKVKS